ncbi:MAG: DUF3160 domain-containing protein [Sedimentisphaerales bacterium]|nr:DUF3160 domain-containing protein [Sedimentisphaerales bacterium]NLT77937.1 DUF3160 domain-containing protein [Planctomycetota bacterium]
MTRREISMTGGATSAWKKQWGKGHRAAAPLWRRCVLVVCLLGTWASAGDSGFGRYYEPYEVEIEPNAPGYTLPLDVGQIVNFDEMMRLSNVTAMSDLIGQNGFAVTPAETTTWWSESYDDIVDAYRHINSANIPLFVTTDTVLHLYHIQFDETLKDVEEREFIGDIKAMTSALRIAMQNQYERFEGELQEAARRNIAFLAVAQKLLEPNWSVSPLVSPTVESELARIEAHAGYAPSDIFIYEEDYSQYVPRGHYTRSEDLERYFKALMWYGRMSFLLKGSDSWGPLGEALISREDARIQTLQAVLLVQALYSEVGERTALEVWDRIYTVTAFYVGTADDLTPYDYMGALEAVVGADWMQRLADLTDEATYLELKTQLALLPSPRIFGGTGNIIVDGPITDEMLNEVLEKTKGMRLMGQRFIPDSYMFQNLVYPSVGQHAGDPGHWPFTMSIDGVRGYPRGLDVMALLGSRQALHILIDEGDTDYVNYWRRFGQLKDEFDALSAADWNANLYWSWLYSLRALLGDLPEGYPNFMRTDAWRRRSLNAALASWTELRHDTILYAKQSYTFGRSARPNTPPPGYVEPVPEFYARLLTLARMTRAGLSDMQVLSEAAVARLTGLENLLERLIAIASKQLLNQPLSEDDAAYILTLASSLEALVTGVENTGLKTTLVADVHTEGYEGMVLEEGVGKVDIIIVACPAADGSVFLAAGPVLSYYEFKHPMSDRLTDEAWRDLLDSPEPPDRPAWYQPLLRATEIPVTSGEGGR